MRYTYTLVIKRDSTENWNASDYIPLEGEPCLDLDKMLIKIGNGVDRFIDIGNAINPLSSLQWHCIFFQPQPLQQYCEHTFPLHPLTPDHLN